MARNRNRNKEQERAYNRAWYDKNKERLAVVRRKWRENNKEKSKAIRDGWEKNNPGRTRLHRIRNRAKNAGIEFDLDHTSVPWTGRCAITGIKFDLLKKGGRPTWNSPSLDRIDSNKGYVKKNCRWILFCINSMRGTMTDKQMMLVAKALAKASSG